MIDYQALRALEAVIEFQSFEKASKSIGITQSAITQRIQGFESYLGERLLVRKTPYQATTTGQAYLGLLRKVKSLESEVGENTNKRPTIKIAINRDSLDLYFLDILSDKECADLFSLEIIADDQNNTLEYLKTGLVDMCISSEKKPLANHTATYLGDMIYCLVCSPHFYKSYFSKNISKDSLVRAPLVIFDKSDKLQHSFLEDNFGIEPSESISQMPSVQSFKTAILGGYGYGLVPILDIEKELKQNKVIEILPSKRFKVPLFIHQWEYQKDYIKFFTKKLIKASEKLN
jgi:LysR family transcriptional regulator, chromosome initiation inhibitor